MKKVAFLLILILVFVFFVKFKNTRESDAYFELNLVGDNIIYLKIGEEYSEPGYEAKDSLDGNITKQVKVTNNINYDIPGTYEVIYSVTNSQKQKLEKKRFVNISLSENITYKASYNDIDNTRREWGTVNKKDGTRSVGNATSEDLKKYDAYYIGPDEKKIYLTFDEGSNETYLKEIVDVLNKKGVKATFFFCKTYIASNPELMKTLVENGHSVGNHTANHVDMTTYANETNYQKYLNEIIQVEETFLKITNTPMDKVYREPRGVWSYRSLEMVKDLGYKTYFWSAAYVDFQDDLTKEEAYSAMVSRMHNGAIYLLHPKNKGNYEALNDFIDEVVNRGYSFDLVKNI